MTEAVPAVMAGVVVVHGLGCGNGEGDEKGLEEERQGVECVDRVGAR